MYIIGICFLVLSFINLYNVDQIKKSSIELPVDYKWANDFIYDKCKHLEIKHPPLLKISNNTREAYIVGNRWRSIIIISRSLFEEVSKDEIKGILAHEIGHLYYNHTTIKSFIVNFKFILREVEASIRILIRFFEFFLNFVPLLGSVAILILNLVSLFFTATIAVYISFLSMFEFITMRLFEYHADSMSIEMGTDKGLLLYLDRILIDDVRGFFNLEEHPRTINRIKRLELIRSKKLRSLNFKKSNSIASQIYVKNSI